MKFDKTKSVWYERYKPQSVDDVILPEKIKNDLKHFIKKEDMPNLGFWSNEPGLGKSSTANAIIKDLGCDALWVNASLEKGIDVLRGKIQTFASQVSFDGKHKIVVLDECLEENEKVIILDDNNNEVPTKLNELVKGEIYKCKSFNMSNGEFENDTCEIISDKEDVIYEVELEDGRTIKVTSNHPFIIEQNGKFVEKTIDDGLCENDNVVCRG